MTESIVSDFVLSKWNAWALGIDGIDAWLAWSKGDVVLHQDKTAAPESFPRILQRRLSLLAKAAFNSADKFATAFIGGRGILPESADEMLPALFDELIADLYPVSPLNIDEDNTFALSLRTALPGESFPLPLSHSSITRNDGEHPIQLLAFL